MKRMLAIIVVALLLPACAKPGLRSAAISPKPLHDPVKLPFWLENGKTGKDDPRIVATDGHPCGGVAYLNVASIPQSNDVIQVDSIVEFDQSGRELTVWHGPTDFVVDQIQGGLIGVSNNHDQSFWIDPNGQLYQRPQMPTQEHDRVDCPQLERFHDSEYLQCLRIKDTRTGRSRLIAWQGICT